MDDREEVMKNVAVIDKVSTGSSLGPIAMMAALGMDINAFLPQDPLRGVIDPADILKEYKLIKEKQSDLPARLRRVIVRRVENNPGCNDYVANVANSIKEKEA